MKRTYSAVLLLLSLVICVQAEEQPSIGMNKEDFKRLFSKNIIEETERGDFTLQLQFFGHHANVFVAFAAGKVFFISASFENGAENEQLSNIKKLREIRLKLQKLHGREDSCLRINGVDVLGNCGATTDERRKNAVGFQSIHGGVIYNLVLFAGTAEELSKKGVLVLNINTEESLGFPKSSEKE